MADNFPDTLFLSFLNSPLIERVSFGFRQRVPRELLWPIAIRADNPCWQLALNAGKYVQVSLVSPDWLRQGREILSPNQKAQGLKKQGF